MFRIVRQSSLIGKEAWGDFEMKNVLLASADRSGWDRRRGVGSV